MKMKVFELQQLLKAKLDEQKALVTGAMDASRAMDEGEQVKFGEIQKEIDNLGKTIEFAKKVEKDEDDKKVPINDFLPAQPKNPNEKKWRSFGARFPVFRLKG